MHHPCRRPRGDPRGRRHGWCYATRRRGGSPISRREVTGMGIITLVGAIVVIIVVLKLLGLW